MLKNLDVALETTTTFLASLLGLDIVLAFLYLRWNRRMIDPFDE